MSLCIGCMHEMGDGVLCPHCGFDNTKTQTAPFLPYGVVLDKRYVIGNNIETNGESTTYIGYDREKGKIVFVREFLPAGYYSRSEGKVKLEIDPAKADTFQRLLSDFEQFFSFLSTLKDMSAMNPITDIFRANNTCYVVEDGEELISFEEYVARNNGMIEWEVARPLFMPVISLLEALHKNGYGHYAVSPANLYITTSGKALLLGFATINERRRGTPLKSQLYSGCAAPEQYEQNFPLDNITDIYGFTATLFYALTGSLPASAPERKTDGALLMSTNTVKRLPPHVVSALANGLQVKREDRIIDFGDLRSQLSVAPTVKAIQDEISRTASMATSVKPKKKNFGMSPLSVGIIVTVVALLVFLWIGILIVDKTVDETDPYKDTTPATQTTLTPIVDDDWKGETLKDYVGQKYSTAKVELEGKGVIVYQTAYADSSDGYSDQYDEGVIMSQSFPEGTPLDAEHGLTVTFKVSKGSLKCELPDDIKGKSLRSVSDSLTDLGFTAVYAEEKASSDVEKGYVICYKDYDAGDKVSRNSDIYLLVSSGKSN
ncbi:MAG: PASTA domain-containing protein [Eubacteriales bacterium]|nr:PASTA domain-containing protein [Eubacteriales bacterium]